MVRVGQIEFIAIFALVIVALVVIILATQGGLRVPDATIALSTQQQAVRSQVTDFIRAGADQALRELSYSGGIAFESRGYEYATGKPVVYWLKDGKSSIPDLEADIQAEIQSYIDENKAGFEEAMEGDVQLGSLAVSFTLFQDRAEVVVDMPTTLDGNTMAIPYVVSIPTQLGEAYGFAKGFVSQQASNRYLEYYTMTSIAISPFKGGHQAVPIYAAGQGCSDFVYMDWFDIAPEAKASVERALGGLYMPGKVPLNTLSTSPSAKFPLPAIAGKEYSSLDFSFNLPDGFGFDEGSLQFNPNPITSKPQVVPFLGDCFTSPTYVEYSIKYPAIARVVDPVTGNTLRFAVEVNIRDNAPAQGAAGYEDSLQEQLCSYMQCSADITVKRTDGTSLAGATVSFLGCGLGRTDAAGRFQAPAPCGAGPLEIHARGYTDYSSPENSASLPAQATLQRKPAIKLQFYTVAVSKVGTKYIISASEFSTKAADKPVDLDTFYSDPTLGIVQNTYRFEGAGTLSLNSGEYGITATLRDPESQTALGAMLTPYTVTESLEGQLLNVYIPVIGTYTAITDQETKSETDFTLTKLLQECGYGPVTSLQAEPGYCDAEESEL